MFILTVIVITISGCAEQPEVQMHQAAQVGDIQTIDSLLKEGNNVDEVYYGTALVWAAEAGQLDAVKFLLQKGANIDARAQQGWTPLGNALFTDKTEVADYLLQKGANVDNTLIGFNDWIGYCERMSIPSCPIKIRPLIAKLNNIKAQRQAESNVKTQQEQQDKMQQEVDKFVADKDFNGLKDYTDKYPNAVYYLNFRT